MRFDQLPIGERVVPHACDLRWCPAQPQGNDDQAQPTLTLAPATAPNAGDVTRQMRRSDTLSSPGTGVVLRRAFCVVLRGRQWQLARAHVKVADGSQGLR